MKAFSKHIRSQRRQPEISTAEFWKKNCGLPFLTDRSGSNVQPIIFII